MTSTQPQAFAATSADPNQPLKDRTYAVTGGAQGIGLATARLLRARGARVSVGDQNESALEKARTVLKGDGNHDGVMVMKVDVADAQSVESWIKETVRWSGGPLDGAVNVAGINGPETGKAPGRNIRRAFRHRDESEPLRHVPQSPRRTNNIKSPGGAIVCVSSVQGRLGFPSTATYSASKHAIIGLVKSVAKEVGHKGIRVNTIAPGAIDTQMVAEKDRNNITTPIARLGTPEECAHLIAFMLSDEAGFITGATFSMDGGWAC